MVEQTDWKRKGTPLFIGECEASKFDFGGSYVFYGRGNPNDIDDDPHRGPVVGRLIFSVTKDNPWGESYYVCYKKESETIEAFIESDDLKKKQVLQDFIQEVYDFKRKRQDPAPAFEKLEDIHEHDVLNQSRLAQARHKLAKKVDKIFKTNLENRQLPKSLKKIEKKISDKLFGKVNG